MADFMTLVIGYLVFFLLTSYIILCGDSEYHRNGIIGKLRSAVIQIVSFIFYVCFPQRLQLVLGNVVTYLFYERNHYIQALYAMIFGGVLWVFSTQVHPRVVELELPVVHIILPYTAMAANLALFVTCCQSDPGVITKKNHDKFAHLFECDGLLYLEGLKCRTCEFVKPARSKHCAYCNHCVYRFDHHCSWINNCVGGCNVRYFLLLLTSIAFVTAYVAYVAGRMLQAIAAQSGIWQAGYFGSDGQYHPVNSRIVFQHLFMELPAVVFLGTSLLLLSILIAVFLSYHLFLLVSNQTTNERYKRSRVKADEVVRSKMSRSPKGKGRGGSGEEREALSHPNLDRACPTLPWRYDRGFWGNIREVIRPP